MLIDFREREMEGERERKKKKKNMDARKIDWLPLVHVAAGD